MAAGKTTTIATSPPSPRPVSPVPDRKAVVRAAKKALKRQDSGSMKIRALARTVAEKMDAKNGGGSGGDDKGGERGGAGPGVCAKSVRRMIEGSGKFSVEGKTVSLAAKKKKKRKRRTSGESDAGGDDGSGNESPKKRRKKEAEVAAAADGAGSASASAAAWRREHGVALRWAPREGEEGDDEERRGADAALAEDPSYRPFETFDMAMAAMGGEGGGGDGGNGASLAAALLRRCTEARKFERPSPIQAQSWPILTRRGSDGKRRDIVGIAETGSGKTLAFALPALTALHDEDNRASSSSSSGRGSGGGGGRGRSGRKPRMLVLAPTRELAMQSHEVLEEFGSAVGLTSVVVYGGVPKHRQTSEVRRGVDCVVATPGRLKDLIQEGSVDLSEVSQLVLDEADRMLDEGFEEDVRFIVSRTLPKESGRRRTAMFSATWPASVARLAAEYMSDPVRVYVRKGSTASEEDGSSNGDDGLSANRRVTQTVEVLEDRDRDTRLRELLRKFYGKNSKNGGKGGPRVLVFALYKKEAERMEHKLRNDGWICSSIHGNKSQSDRTRALSVFRDGSVPLLVATDVAARGLDIPDVEAVINYTFPLTVEDYVHRIGRTGRAGKDGVSHTFFQPGDKARAGELQRVLREAGQPVPDELAKFGSTIKRKEHKLYGNFGPSGGTGGAPMKKATKIVFNRSDDEE